MDKRSLKKPKRGSKATLAKLKCIYTETSRVVVNKDQCESIMSFESGCNLYLFKLHGVIHGGVCGFNNIILVIPHSLRNIITQTLSSFLIVKNLIL